MRLGPLDLQEIEIKEHHLKLLGRLNIGWNDYAYEGAPGVDPKRPFGNSYVIGDLYEITEGREWDEDEQGDMPDSKYDGLLRIFYEMEFVLLIAALETSKGRLLTPGKFRKTSRYDRWSWERVPVEHKLEFTDAVTPGPVPGSWMTGRCSCGEWQLTDGCSVCIRRKFNEHAGIPNEGAHP